MAFLAFLEGLLTLHSRGSVEVREGPLARGARTVQLDHHHSLHLLLLPAWRSPTPRDHSYAGLVPNLAPRTHLTSLTTEQPSCSLPSAAAGHSHPPADIETSTTEPGADPGLAEGWPVGSRRRAGQQPTTGLSLVVHFGRQEARAVHRVPAAAADAGAEMESGLRTCFPTHPSLTSLLRPWLGHSPKP